MNRCKEEIVENILEICKEPANKSAIVYRANLNFKNVDRYLEILINAGILETIGTTPTKYKITSKGLDILTRIKAFNDLLRMSKKGPERLQ